MHRIKLAAFGGLIGVTLMSLPAHALSLGGGGHAGGGVIGGAGVNTPGIDTRTGIDTPVGSSNTHVDVPATRTDVNVNGDTDADAHGNERYNHRHHYHPMGSSDDSSVRANSATSVHTTDTGRTGALATGSANITATNPGGAPSIETGTHTNTILGR